MPCLQGGLWTKLRERLADQADAAVEHGGLLLRLPDGGRISITKARAVAEKQPFPDREQGSRGGHTAAL